MDTSGTEKDVLDQILGELSHLRDENAAVREENQRLAARIEALAGGSVDGGEL